jgi:hypothetical protein
VVTVRRAKASAQNIPVFNFYFPGKAGFFEACLLFFWSVRTILRAPKFFTTSGHGGEHDKFEPGAAYVLKIFNAVKG